MRIRTTISLISILLLLSFLAVVSARQPHARAVTTSRLAIEIGLDKPWTLNAAGEGQALRAFLRLPNSSLGYSAIKLMPKMVGNKVEVSVSTLAGDISAVKTCKDWATLKETFVATYTLGEGEQITVPQLSNLGQNFRNGVLTFKAVAYVMPPKGDVEPIDGGGDSTPCGCGRCDRLYCCPNKGACLGCGTCGDVCCGN